MEVMKAIGIGLAGGAAIGYVLTATSVPEGGRVFFVFGIVVVMVLALGGAITPASGPEEGILANAKNVALAEFGLWTVISASIAGSLVAGLTSDANRRNR
jgi:hypothetical protein